MEKAIQDYYTERFAHCYGCGRNNEDGWHLKSYVRDGRTVMHFTPKDCHTGGYPGFVYGGLLAALLDCHGTATACYAGCVAENRALDSEPFVRYVTASLQVDYLRPTPHGVELEIWGDILEVKGRKAIIGMEVYAKGTLCVKGKMIAVQIPN